MTTHEFQEILDDFLSSSRELLEKAEDGLLAVESADAALSAEDLSGLKRVFHTLKGNSAMMGFDAVARAAHVHALRDVGGLRMDGREHAGGLEVEAVLGFDIPNGLGIPVDDGIDQVPLPGSESAEIIALATQEGVEPGKKTFIGTRIQQYAQDADLQQYQTCGAETFPPPPE